MQWLENDFLGYLDEWEEDVKSREGFEKDEQNLMLLSSETMTGLRMTGETRFWVTIMIIYVPFSSFYSSFFCRTGSVSFFLART